MKDSHLTLRLPDDLARALTRWARTRGRPKSEVVREAVSRYLAPAPPEPAGRRLAARDLAARWPDLPRLEAGEAAALGEDVARARVALPAVRSSWE
jgi:hypothetical protein